MKNIYKKLSLAFATAAMVAPISAIVACSKEQAKSELPNIKIQDEKFENFKDDQIWTSNFTEQDIKNENFNVPEDGVYLVKSAYKGRLWDGTKDSGHEVTDNVSRVYAGLYNKSVTELGDSDSLYVLYDNDDNDGFTANKFSDQFLLNDTSIMNQNEILNINISYGNKAIQTQWGNVPHVAFKNGVSTSYIGSQSNHMGISFDQAMEKIKTQVDQKTYEVIQNYYNNASKSFVPVMHESGMFSYEKVSNKAYKITYHYTANSTPITAATFKLVNDNKTMAFGTLSLGDKNEWSSYENSNNGNSYEFQARKE